MMADSTGIIVLGPYRSGTSVTAQVLRALGVDFGPKRYLVPAHDWNPGGHYERVDVNDANDALIRSAGKTLADPGDPADLVEKGDRASFQLADMSWKEKRGIWGIKDPRMCATLLAWLEAGIVDRKNIKIIHVRRGIKSAVKSAMLCPPVRNFCDGTEAGAERMLQKYATLAQWHVDTLGIETLGFDYERLIQQPQAVVVEIAQFLGVTRPNQIRKATQLIGKGKGRFALQMERYFIRGPIRVIRYFTGHSPLRPK
jgi:hypothetical protein